jgi:hypothetical protein
VAGVRTTTVICGGKIYEFDWSTETFTEVVTAANLVTASVALSSTARVALVPFADGIVVSDGVNLPFWWDGSSGAAGIVDMTNAVISTIPPTVYYSKLFLWNGGTLYWSEEGTPNTGYGSGGYNNAWENPGGYADPVTSIAGTNEALYVFRSRVSLAITGAVTPDFATAGTRANLSTNVGTLSPWATHVTDRGVIIVDADAQPWLMRYGAQPVSLWHDCRQTVSTTPRSSLSHIQTVEDGATESIVLLYPDINGTHPSLGLCFAASDLQFVSVWSWNATVQRVGSVIDGNGVARWAHAGVDDGRLYVHGELSTGPWTDALQSATQYIAHDVIACTLGYDLDRELQLDQLEAALTGGGITRVSVSYETPYGQTDPMAVDLTTSTAGGSWDTDEWAESDDDADGMEWAEPGSTDQRFRAGLFGAGRWVRPRISHDEVGERFGMLAMRLRVFARQGNPRSP